MAHLIKELMEDLGVTQMQLRDMTGISQQQISRYTNGVMPSAQNLKKIADALGVEVADLTRPGLRPQYFVCPHCGHKYQIKEIK